MSLEEGERSRRELITFADLRETERLRIKVIGVGGAGGDAVNRLIESGVDGVEFLAVDTHAMELRNSRASVKIQIGQSIAGKRGGTGGNPLLGKQAALWNAEVLLAALEGADIVFAAAGLGGGTGTGASSIIGSLAAEVGALTIAIVSKPLGIEGIDRQVDAERGMNELLESFDRVINVANELPLNQGNKMVPSIDASALAEGLSQVVRTISDIITKPGFINVDFADVRAIMEGRGAAFLGTGAARGENRAVEAAQRAVSSPLLEGVSIEDVDGLLVNVTGSSDLSLFEVNEAMNVIHDSANPEADIRFGALIDEDLSDTINITLIATHLRSAVRLSESGQGASAMHLAKSTTEFDALITSMQSPEARTGMETAFNASPEELGRAAVKAARKRHPLHIHGAEDKKIAR